MPAQKGSAVQQHLPFNLWSAGVIRQSAGQTAVIGLNCALRYHYTMALEAVKVLAQECFRDFLSIYINITKQRVICTRLEAGVPRPI